ncbi:GNAT family N-acetyltransferase [Pontibacter akesuensis]|uniref:Protein N-acetyltransferase, RimJ/RimL family n=1 Tax=Pontibacter akesuensis TaxID=388950 RepID=A0A1I7H3T1_9BACT|nr:GNAT family protein [Pontibacter akesuensis]GHA53609.1 N-acetyltransferase [Pontibacter akesuensis]SFU55331.1 Protein N-acetyltransferase, RimJ/RimL family [Pontibacter akesuensis]
MKSSINQQLENERVLLRRYQPSDLEQLRTIVFEEEIWRFMPTRISNVQELQAWAQIVEQGHAAGTRYTFMIIDKASGKLAGSTSYGNISAVDKRLEIGWTWLSREHRSTGLNRHCKFLLLRHAFEELGMERVELKTDVLNKRSRSAMLKIGATEEGVLRSHTQMHDGRRRDTIYYSILLPEWPSIKARVFGDLYAAQAPD